MNINSLKKLFFKRRFDIWGVGGGEFCKVKKYASAMEKHKKKIKSLKHIHVYFFFEQWYQFKKYININPSKKLFYNSRFQLRLYFFFFPIYCL